MGQHRNMSFSGSESRTFRARTLKRKKRIERRMEKEKGRRK
jgi:hypothetical protein